MNTIIKLIQVYMAAVWIIALIITSPIWITAVIIEKHEHTNRHPRQRIEELEDELNELRKL